MGIRTPDLLPVPHQNFHAIFSLDLEGIEPSTSCMQNRRSTIELQAREWIRKKLNFGAG